MDIYEKIQLLCKANKISVRQLERELQFGNNTIGKWKTSKPSVDKLQLVAEYFNKPISYFRTPGLYLGSVSTPGLHNLVYEIVDQAEKNVIRISIPGEPNFSLQSKAACKLLPLLKDMDEKDIDFLVETARRISPKRKKNVIVVSNPNNLKTPPSMKDKNSLVPFPQYPTVTNKDIDEFAARNAKKKFTREEIAEMLYEMKQEDE